MTSQARTEAAQSCAHCAFVAPGLHFQVITPAAVAAPIAFQKRVARFRPEEPAARSDPEEDPPESPPAPIQRSHIRQTGIQQRIQPHTPQSAPFPIVDEVIAPQKKSPYFRWFVTLILFIAVCGVTGMLVWEKIQQRIEIERQNTAVKAAGQSMAVRTPAPLNAAATSRLEGSIITHEASSDAERLVKVLFSESNLEERLTAIENPQRYRPEVETFFDRATDRPQLISVTPISNPPISIREQSRIPMFKVVTRQNRSGALAWILRGEKGEPLIHWPLFRETHERALRKFLLEKPETPAWFFVGLRRTHPFDLPEDQRSEHEAFDIDGSTDGSGRTTVFINKKTPLCRTLNGKIQWSEFYYGQVLVSWMDVGGEKRFAMLDCETSADPALPDEK